MQSEYFTGLGDGHRPPGVPLDSWTACAGLQRWRTRPSWAPDQTQKCVALTLACDVKLRGRQEPGLASQGSPWGPLFQIEPLPGLPLPHGNPSSALERDLGDTTTILHLICPQAEKNRQ